MSDPKQPLMLTLPDSLRARFQALEARLWRCDAALLAGRVAGSIAASYAGVWLCDRIGDTPGWLRAGWGLAGLAGAGVAAWLWHREWGGRGSDIRRLSRIVQKRYRALGDTLLGIVELSDEKTRPADFSPQLYAAAIAQVAERAMPLDFALAADPGPARRQGWITAGLGGAVVILVLISPEVAGNAALRWTKPIASIERKTLVDWESLPVEVVIAHGENFEVRGQARYRSFWKPGAGKVSIDGGRARGFELKSGRLQEDLPGLVKEGRVVFKLGDATRAVVVKPVHRPALRKLEAAVRLPDYLEYGPTNLAVQGGVLGVLEGSSLKVLGEATRSLQAVHVTSTGTAGQEWKVKEAGFESGEFQAASGETLAISWRDTLGLSNAPAWQLTLQTEKDIPPTVELPDLAREVAMLESEVLEVKVLARDDFGVKELGLKWETVETALAEGAATNRAEARPGFKHRARSAREPKLQETFSFSPGLHGFKADSSVDLQAVAVDYKPGRDAAVSTLYRIHVLGAERHAEMVRQRLEALLSRLEEVTRAEERVNAATRELQQAPESLSEQAAATKAGELAEEQKQNAELLNQLAQEGIRTLREAARNPALNDQTLRQWANHLQSMKEVSSKSMAQASKALQAAKQSPKDRKEKLAEAKEKEEEAIESLEQLQKDVNAGLDDLQALTLAQRLRKLSDGQSEIQTRMQKVISDTIGLLPSELSDRHKRLHKALADEQGGMEEESKKVEGEISRFFERTRRMEYGRVSQDMRSARPAEELERVRGLITDNIGMQAMQQLGVWTERFKDWAQALEPKSNSSNSSNSNGQKIEGEDAEKLMEMLLGLLRSRESQAGLRERTRMLDQQGRQEEGYEDAARILAGSQQKLIFRMDQLMEENNFKPLAPILQEAFLNMRTAENLLSKPRTDKPTLDSQKKSLELITDAINLINEQTERGGQQQSKSGAPSAEEMAFLMQMMQEQGQGMAPSPGQGGSQSGGGTGSGAAQTIGNADGKSGNGRAVSRGSGVGGALPSEFREALESYFQELEAPEK